MRLILATRNARKAREIRDILSDRFDYLTLCDFPQAPEVVEDAETFEGNATKKAAALAQWIVAGDKPAREGDFVLADDSGLEVDVLQGAPGVHSARFAALDNPSAEAGRNSSDAENNAKLLRLLDAAPREKRTARFRCVLALIPLLRPALASTDELYREARVFEGTCEGRIAFAPSGAGGFGYDPLFVPNGYEVSFAELGEHIKNALSHRARALQQLSDYFKAQV